MQKHRIFITGDTHGSNDIQKLNSKAFTLGNELTKNDIVIICGDAGFVWDGKKDKELIEWISNKPWTTIYCDGNHEHHDLLRTYPIVDFYGAKAHKISDSLYHILRGEIMIIDNKKYFFFGGGFSHDIEYRTELISWWQNELPVQEEIDNAISNLKTNNMSVDYIIIHDVPQKINLYLGYNEQSMKYYRSKYINLSTFLQYVYDTVEFKDWFAGHYHVDRNIYDNFHILFHCIDEIKENGIELLKTPYYDVVFANYSFDDVKRIAIKRHLYVNEGFKFGNSTLNGRTVLLFKDFLDKYEDTLSDNEKDFFVNSLKNYLLLELKNDKEQ